MTYLLMFVSKCKKKKTEHSKLKLRSKHSNQHYSQIAVPYFKVFTVNSWNTNCARCGIIRDYFKTALKFKDLN